MFRGRLPVDESQRREALDGIVSLLWRALLAAGADARGDAMSRELAGHLVSGGQEAGPVDIHIRLDPSQLQVEVVAGGPEDRHEPAFRTWLLQRLRAEGLSQESAARRIGVSTRTVGRWARGQTQPRMRDLPRVREALGELPAF